MNKIVKYKNLTDNLCSSLTFYVFAIILEIVGGIIVNGTIPRLLIVSVFFIHFFAVIIFLLPTSIFRIIFSMLLLVFQSVVTIANQVIYTYSGEIFTFDKLVLAQGVMGGGVFSISMIDWSIVFLFLMLCALALTLMLLLRAKLSLFRPNNTSFFSILKLYFVFHVIQLTCVVYPLTHNVNDLDMLKTQFPSVASYKVFGYYSFYILDGVNSLKINQSLKEMSIEEYKQFILDGENSDTTNYMSGVSSDNDVIMILAESLDIFGIDSYFTPNLYSLMSTDTRSMYMSEYYSENKTHVSETFAFLGSYSADTPLSFIGTDLMFNLIDRYTITQKLKDVDSSVSTEFYHGYEKLLYNRVYTHPNLSFDATIFARDQEADIKQYNIDHNQEYHWTTNEFYSFIKDSNFIEYNLDRFIPTKDTGRIFRLFSTITTHGFYTLRDSNKEYYDILTHPDNAVYLGAMLSDLTARGFYPNNKLDYFLYYKSAMMDLDKTIGIIMDRLEATGRLDDTTIVIFSDHNAYYDNLSWGMRGIADADIKSCTVSAYHLPCIIYDKDMTDRYRVEKGYTEPGAIVNDTFMSVMDIYPTVCNMLGFDYNTSMTYGVSIFDELPHVFMTFKDSGYIFDNNFYYEDGVVKSLKDGLDSAYFISLVRAMLDKFHIQESLYNNVKLFNNILNE